MADSHGSRRIVPEPSTHRAGYNARYRMLLTCLRLSAADDTTMGDFVSEITVKEGTYKYGEWKESTRWGFLPAVLLICAGLQSCLNWREVVDH
jgi:hypothetical protein